MANEDQVYVAQGSALMVTDTASVADLEARMSRMSQMIKLKVKFLNDNLVQGIHNDYAVIPGTKEKSLLKPGAEKLLEWFGLYASFTLTASSENFDIGLFSYVYRCDIKVKGTNMLVAQCEGDASTYESKYRFEWRTINNLPAGLNAEMLPKKNFAQPGDPEYIKYQILVENPADKRNTVRKMAQKRALVGATVLATATSDIFTTKDPDDESDNGSAGTGGTQNAHVKGADYKALIKGRMASKYGEPDKPSKCAFCGEFHVKKGDSIVIVDGDDGKKLYGFEKCLAVKWAEEHPAQEPEPAQDSSPDKPAEQPSEGSPSGSQGTTAPSGGAGATINEDQVAAVFKAITAAKAMKKDFLAFMVEFDKAYQGADVKDIRTVDYDRLMSLWAQAAKEGLA